MVAHDRLVRPRPPRSRAVKRRKSPIGARAEWTVRVLLPLSKVELESICATIKSARLKGAYLRRGLQDTASTYMRRRTQPAPLKSEARHGLALIVYKVLLLEQQRLDPAILKPDLRRTLNSLNGLAMTALWRGLDGHLGYDGPNFHTYLMREDLDWQVVGDAAEFGLSRLTGGDYADGAAVIAMQELVALYEGATRTTATLSLRAVGPVNDRGRQREVGNSECFRFIVAFFKEVDPKVDLLWITGKLRIMLRLRKKRALAESAQSFPRHARHPRR